MDSFRRLTAACLLLAATGCASTIKDMTATAMLGTFKDVNDAALKGKDPLLVRDGLPGSLIIMDGLLEGAPNNEGLLSFAAMTNAQYGFIFLEETDPARARIYYEKAKGYAVRSIQQSRSDFSIDGTVDEFAAQLSDFDADDVPTLFWLEMAWGSWINLSRTSPDAIAQAPKVQALMDRVIELDETFFNAGPHLLAGVYYGSRSEMFGGNRKKADHHFERCFELTGGRFLMPYVFYAKYPAVQWQDLDKFKAYLQKVIDAPDDLYPEQQVANEMAKQMARRLLDDVEEYFDIEPPEEDEGEV